MIYVNSAEAYVVVLFGVAFVGAVACFSPVIFDVRLLNGSRYDTLIDDASVSMMDGVTQNSSSRDPSFAFEAWHQNVGYYSSLVASIAVSLPLIVDLGLDYTLLVSTLSKNAKDTSRSSLWRMLSVWSSQRFLVSRVLLIAALFLPSPILLQFSMALIFEDDYQQAMFHDELFICTTYARKVLYLCAVLVCFVPRNRSDDTASASASSAAVPSPGACYTSPAGSGGDGRRHASPVQLQRQMLLIVAISFTVSQILLLYSISPTLNTDFCVRAGAFAVELLVCAFCVTLTVPWLRHVIISRKLVARLAKGGSLISILQDDYYCILVLLMAVLGFVVSFVTDSLLGTQYMLGVWDDISAEGRVVLSYEAMVFAAASCLILGRQSRVEMVSRKDDMLDAKKSFVRYISHEIRTPLNTVFLGLKLLRDDFELSDDPVDEERLVVLRDVVSGCDDALSILNDLLSYDKLESGSLSLEKKEEPIISLLQEALHMFSFQADSAGVSLALEVSDHHPVGASDCIHIDKNKMLQVMRNLLSNALKFTPRKGKITVRVKIVTQAAPPAAAAGTTIRRNNYSWASSVSSGSNLSLPLRYTSSVLSLATMMMAAEGGGGAGGGNNTSRKSGRAGSILSSSRRRILTSRGGAITASGRLAASSQQQQEGSGGGTGTTTLLLTSRGTPAAAAAAPAEDLQTARSTFLRRISDDELQRRSSVATVPNLRRLSSSKGAVVLVEDDMPAVNDPDEEVFEEVFEEEDERAMTTSAKEPGISSSVKQPRHRPRPLLLNRHLIVEVIDTGVGIAPENVSRLFNEVVQINAAEMQKGGGSGFGLLLTKGLVEQHGGTIRVSSEGLHKGTKFTVTLPLPPLAASRDDGDLLLPVLEESYGPTGSTTVTPQPQVEEADTADGIAATGAAAIQGIYDLAGASSPSSRASTVQAYLSQFLAATPTAGRLRRSLMASTPRSGDSELVPHSSGAEDLAALAELRPLRKQALPPVSARGGGGGGGGGWRSRMHDKKVGVIAIPSASDDDFLRRLPHSSSSLRRKRVGSSTSQPSATPPPATVRQDETYTEVGFVLDNNSSAGMMGQQSSHGPRVKRKESADQLIDTGRKQRFSAKSDSPLLFPPMDFSTSQKEELPVQQQNSGDGVCDNFPSTNPAPDSGVKIADNPDKNLTLLHAPTSGTHAPLQKYSLVLPSSLLPSSLLSVSQRPSAARIDQYRDDGVDGGVWGTSYHWNASISSSDSVNDSSHGPRSSRGRADAQCSSSLDDMGSPPPCTAPGGSNVVGSSTISIKNNASDSPQPPARSKGSGSHQLFSGDTLEPSFKDIGQDYCNIECGPSSERATTSPPRPGPSPGPGPGLLNTANHFTSEESEALRMLRGSSRNSSDDGRLAIIVKENHDNDRSSECNASSGKSVSASVLSASMGSLYVARPDSTGRCIPSSAAIATQRLKSTATELTNQRPCNTSAAAAKTAALHSQRPCILVVDDSPPNRKMLLRLLTIRGYRCEEARDGKEAVDMVRERCYSASPSSCPTTAPTTTNTTSGSNGNRNNGFIQTSADLYYDAILMDFVMPVMDGPTACVEIRKLGYKGPIIGVTGNALQGDIDTFMGCGASSVLAKPLNMDAFLAIMAGTK